MIVSISDSPSARGGLLSRAPAAAILAAAALAALPLAATEDPAAQAPEPPRVEMATSKGTIVLELYPDKAPETVANFLRYVRQGFYEGTIFHRVIPGFMVQGGGYGSDLALRPPAGKIQNEADNGLSNLRGTIAMARQGDPHTATCQFFINHVDNQALDHRDKSSGRTWGYTVFGEVETGMDVVDAIADTPTHRHPKGMPNVPVEPVVIEGVVWVNPPPDLEEPTVSLD